MTTSPSSSEVPELVRSLACAAGRDALASAANEWHAGHADACQIDYQRAARIVADAIFDRFLPRITAVRTEATPSADSRSSHIRLLRRRIDKLEHLADEVCHATVWDYTVYEKTPGDEWLAIDRDHYQSIVRAIADVDTWSPWDRRLERRLGDV